DEPCKYDPPLDDSLPDSGEGQLGLSEVKQNPNASRTALVSLPHQERVRSLWCSDHVRPVPAEPWITAIPHCPSISNRSSRFPSGQSPRPESPFTCPTAPISTNRLPQLRAISRARSTVRNGSLLLATTIDGNGSSFLGTG